MNNQSPLFQTLERQLEQVSDKDLWRQRRVVDRASNASLTVDDRSLLNFCSNDYLGLASHPQLIEALQEGAQRYGAGSGASHMISGHFLPHELLESRLAELQSAYVPNARALYFSTGYMANVGLLSALAALEPQSTEIFSEQLNHASLIDGTRLSRCNKQVYPHLDMPALEHMLAESSAINKVVVTDSVFSMDGVIAPIHDLLVLCERYNAWLVVDDAHGFGVLGEDGHGVLQHLNLRSDRLVYVGTLGKAAGVSGAFVAATPRLIEWLIQKARSYIFTTAASPAIAHALLTSLELITSTEGQKRRRHLWRLVSQFKSGFDNATEGVTLLPSATQILPVLIGSNTLTMQYAAELYQQEFWVGAIRPPTVPADTARLRITLSAAHTEQQVDALITALIAVKKKLTR